MHVLLTIEIQTWVSNKNLSRRNGEKNKIIIKRWEESFARMYLHQPTAHTQLVLYGAGTTCSSTDEWKEEEKNTEKESKHKAEKCRTTSLAREKKRRRRRRKGGTQQRVAWKKALLFSAAHYTCRQVDFQSHKYSTDGNFKSLYILVLSFYEILKKILNFESS